MRRSRMALLLILGMVAALLPMGVAPAAAATTLNPGDLAVVGINADNNAGGLDEIAFVLLVPVDAGTEIRFTDSGWLSSGSFRGNEGAIKYTAPTALAAGTVVNSVINAADFAADNDGIVGNNGFALSASGDQVFAFQGASDSPSFIFAAQTNSTMFQADATASTNSALPTGLTVGATAVAVGSGPGAGDEYDNSEYNSSVTSGTRAALLAVIANNANWNGSNSLIVPLPSGPFTVGVPVDVPPTVSSTVPASGDTGVAIDSDVVVAFSEPVTVTNPWFGISCVDSGIHTAAMSGGPSTFTLNPDGDFANDELCTVTLTAAQIVDQDDPFEPMESDYSWSFTTAPAGELITLIHDVQGADFSSPMVGDMVTIEGVVVGDFQQADGYPNATYDNDIDGYHVQEEDFDADADPLTSEGIFVRDNDNAVAVGDVVKVTGTVAESFGLTRIQDVTAALVNDPIDPAKPTTVTPATVALPISGNIDFESVEGMSVLLPQALVIAEYFNFDRFNETVLTTDRAAQPTAVFAPGSPQAAALADLNARSRITLDDGRGSQNPDPAIHPNGRIFDLTNLFRGGDTVANVTGAMDYSFGAYKVQATIAPDFSGGGEYASTNARPTSPAGVGGDLTVATFNVLNYFTTLDNAGPICGPGGDQGCRGADTAEEFTRQKTKIIRAIADIDADVVGLMEIENDAVDVAVDDLVDGLNAATAPGTYANIVTGPVGPDAIRVALIYKPGSVTPYGAHAVLEGAFLDPNNLGSAKNRAALAQSFVDNADGGVFTVAVNHLKSKGSQCGTGDDDPEQGSCNLTRTLAAGMLADWLGTDPTGSGDADFLIIGDLNSYDMEDPISLLAGRGYTDLVLRDLGDYAYSYVFSGQWGYLDYIMSNRAATPQVTDTTIWHINADEPDILDYDMSFKKPAQEALWEPNAFRSSDHDPVIVGLELTVTPMQAKEHALGTLAALLPTGNKQDDKRISKAIESIEDSLNSRYWVDDTHLTDKGNKVFDEEKKAVKDLMKVRGPAEADVQHVIDALVKADETLAATAIDEAIAAGGDAQDIAKAEREMGRALDDLGRDRPDKAIDHYKKAWSYAQKALDDVPARFATFNAALNRRDAGDLVTELSSPGSAQPATIAEIIQRNRPDVLLVNEFDYDAGGVAAELFQENYLSMSQGGADPIVYPYRYVAPSNTGVPSGFDLNNNGVVGGPDDAFGFGFFEGQYAFVVYSMYPIDDAKIRTFQNFLWRDMPGALLPEDPPGTPWFTDDELDVVRLSSKNHVDVPIRVDGKTVHFLVSHPTPPVFDGDEDRNGKRNYDEIRFWADYVSGGKTARYIYDDAGKTGGLSGGAKFVIAGDLNSDPFDGDSYPGSAQLLLDHPKVNDTMTPSSLGGPEQAADQGGANIGQGGNPAFDTADFADFPGQPGNLRADYVLARKNMKIVASGVFWPLEADPLFPLVGVYQFPGSDHRLVWIDIDQ